MPKLGPDPFIHPHAYVQNAKMGSFVEIGEGARILESTIGNYSYTDRYADMPIPSSANL